MFFIDRDTTTTIVFARFELAVQFDSDASFMPPPLNVLAIGGVALFYVVDTIVECVSRLCCRQKYDILNKFAPAFVKRRQLSLDEQILYDNCKRYWYITTNKGKTKCKVVKFAHSTKEHYVKFYDDDDRGIRVSVRNDVAKKHGWMLDLLELCDQGLMDLDQFAEVNVDNEWMLEVFCWIFFYDLKMWELT